MSDVYVGLPPGPPPRRSNPWAWVIGLGIAAGVALVLAAGGLVYFGWTLFRGEVQAVLQDDPAIVRHIGTIESMDLDFTATGEIDSPDGFVFDVVGDRGRGRVVAEFVTGDDGEALESGTLTLADGREVALGEAGEGAPAASEGEAAEAAAVPEKGTTADSDAYVAESSQPSNVKSGGTVPDPAPESEPDPEEID